MMKFLCAAAFAAIVAAAFPAGAQQMGERNDGFQFKVLGNNAALNKAVAIEQAEEGFSDGYYYSGTYNTTMNESNAIGTMTEIQAILDGDSSTVNLSANPVQDNTGTQGSTSDQSAHGTPNGTGGTNGGTNN